VSLKEARGAANDLMQRQVALSKLEIEQKSSDSSATIAEQLTFLKQQFAAFNTNRTIEQVPAPVLEVEEKSEDEDMQEVSEYETSDEFQQEDYEGEAGTSTEM
jgi:aspartate ammonia-lyase